MANTLRFSRTFPAIVVLVALLSFSMPSAAQVQGNNAVYNSNGNCNSNSACAGSSAFIDGGWPRPSMSG